MTENQMGCQNGLINLVINKWWEQTQLLMAEVDKKEKKLK